MEHDLQLFKELPQHLRAQVAWRSNKPIFEKIHTFQVGLEQKQHQDAIGLSRASHNPRLLAKTVLTFLLTRATQPQPVLDLFVLDVMMNPYVFIAVVILLLCVFSVSASISTA